MDGSRRLVLIAAGVAVVAGGALGLSLRARRGGCAADRAALWDEAARGRLRQAFLATGRANAAESFDRVAAALEDETADWARRREAACEVPARAACLDRRRDELAALIRALGAVDGPAVDNARGAVFELIPLTVCDGAVPAEVDGGAEVAAARAELEATWAQVLLGRIKDSRPAAHRAVEKARALGHEPLLLEALFLMGRVMTDLREGAPAEAVVREADALAARLGRPYVRARLATHLVLVVGRDAGRAAEAVALARELEPVVAAAGDPMARARFLRARAIASGMITGGDDAERRDLEEALSLLDASVDPSRDARAAILNSLGNVLRRSGELDAARVRHEEALQLFETLYGEHHPFVAGSLHNLANLAIDAGDPAAAERLQRRALAIQVGAYGDEHLDVALTRTNLGTSLVRLGRLEEARAQLVRALALRQKLMPPDHQLITTAMEHLGEVERVAGRLDEAARILEESLGRRVAKQGATARATLEAIVKLATVRRLQGDGPALAALVARPRGELDDAALRAAFLHLEAEALLLAGRPADARVPAEEAVAVLDRTRAPRADRGGARFALARALWDGGGDRARALALATEARDKLVADGPWRDADAAAVTAWLETRR